jgi:hypothetical protein
VQKDTTVSMLDYFWKISPEKIATYHTDGEFFYRTIAIPLSEAESNLEGEIKERLYLLKGEYGEYPDGSIYSLGDFYNIISSEVIVDGSSVTVIIQYGSTMNPKEVKVSID